MTINDKSTIQRALGRIEGVAACLNEDVANELYDAVEMIDNALDETEPAKPSLLDQVLQGLTIVANCDHRNGEFCMGQKNMPKCDPCSADCPRTEK